MHAGGSWLHPVTRWALYERARYLCHYCRVLLSPGESAVRERGVLRACDDAATLDHVYTWRARHLYGGPRHAFTVVSCWGCNLAAGAPCSCAKGLAELFATASGARPVPRCECGGLDRRVALLGGLPRWHLLGAVLKPEQCAEIARPGLWRHHAEVAMRVHSQRGETVGLFGRDVCRNCGPRYLAAYGCGVAECELCDDIPF